MEIHCTEHYAEVKKYAQSIGDTTFTACIEKLKKWEQNIYAPSTIHLYFDHSPHSFGFSQIYENGKEGTVGGLLYHGNPGQSNAVLLTQIHGWSTHT